MGQTLPSAPDVVPASGGVALPAHVAIIMDGNGRWAQKRGLPRVMGHTAGLDALRRTVRASIELNIRALTIYSFSSENWSRPASEVSELMALLRAFVASDLEDLKAAGVRVRIIGEREGLAADIVQLLDDVMHSTQQNSRLDLIVAFNYGARQELARAASKLAVEVAAGRLSPEKITQETFGAALDTADVPDPDLLIRTSGEHRLSNFLLWQCAYAEFYFTDVLWPDFTKADLESALQSYAQRERRFGGLGNAK